MGITANGYETTPESAILTEVQDAFKDALGTDLSLDVETPQGQLIAMITDMLHQIDLNRQSDFYSRDIYRAQGLQLDIIGRELDIPRREAVPTQVLITLQGAVNYTVLSGTQATIITDNSQVFQFTDDFEITAASSQVTLTAVDGGVYENLTVGQKLQTQEYTPQIYDMTITSIIYGQAAESDYQYRLRLIEAQSSGVDEVAHLTLELENVENVLSAYVEPNNTLETSATGIPPHAVEIVVLGGAEADIAQVLMDNLFATPTYQDPTLGEEISGTDYNGHTQTFYITRPQQVNVSVQITYVNKMGQTLSSDNIADITSKITQLINATYMNKTLYNSDICNLATDGYTQIYAIKSMTVTVGSSPVTDSYTCTSRQYLYASSVTLSEAE